jgi:hypothetical protein
MRSSVIFTEVLYRAAPRQLCAAHRKPQCGDSNDGSVNAII